MLSSLENSNNKKDDAETSVGTNNPGATVASIPSRNNDNDGGVDDNKKDNNSNINNNPSGIRVIDTGLQPTGGTRSSETAAGTAPTRTTTTTMGSTTITGLPMDWTQMGVGGASEHAAPVIRYPLDVVPELDVTDGEFVSVGTAGQKMTHLGPNFSTLLVQACREQGVERLQKLILRSHLIHKMEGLEELYDVQLLELYDNQ